VASAPCRGLSSAAAVQPHLCALNALLPFNPPPLKSPLTYSPAHLRSPPADNFDVAFSRVQAAFGSRFQFSRSSRAVFSILPLPLDAGLCAVDPATRQPVVQLMITVTLPANFPDAAPLFQIAPLAQMLAPYSGIAHVLLDHAGVVTLRQNFDELPLLKCFSRATPLEKCVEEVINYFRRNPCLCEVRAAVAGDADVGARPFPNLAAASAPALPAAPLLPADFDEWLSKLTPTAIAELSAADESVRAAILRGKVSALRETRATSVATTAELERIDQTLAALHRDLEAAASQLAPAQARAAQSRVDAERALADVDHFRAQFRPDVLASQLVKEKDHSKALSDAIVKQSATLSDARALEDFCQNYVRERRAFHEADLRAKRLREVPKSFEGPI
jgi:hypothetical protein